MASAAVCGAYIGGALLYESITGQVLPQDLRFWGALGLGIASALLLIAALWCLKNPGEYRAEVTRDRLIINHPAHDGWCMDVPIEDIKRFEYRQSHSPGGKGTLQHGVLLHSGEFHHVNMNYGVSLKKLFRAVQHVNPKVTFPSRTNKRFAGLINRDYER